MAGATNRALKAAGVPKGAIKTIRVTGGRGVSLRSAIAIAQSHGIALPDKVHAHLAKRDGKAAQKAGVAEARRAENAAFEAQHKARTEARHIYEGQNRESLGAMQDLRARVRANVENARRKQNEYDQIKRDATAKAERDAGKAKRGAVNEVRRNRAVEVAVANNPAVQRAAAEVKQARASLQSALASRNATATARKQQRGAESGGQQDLFSGAPAPRKPSPFERRMALRDARALKGAQALGAVMSARRKADAARPARAAALARSVGAASAQMMAARRAAGPAPADLIRAAEKKHLQGMSIAGTRDFARRRLVDVGTARAKVKEERALLAKRAAAVNAARGRYERSKAEQDVNTQRYYVQKAESAHAKAFGEVKDTLRAVRKAEAALPPDVRKQVRPQRQPKSGPMSSPEARAKMAAVKARLPELRAAREARLKQAMVRGDTQRGLRGAEMQYGPAAKEGRGSKTYERAVKAQARATGARNRALQALKRQIGDDKAISWARISESVSKSASHRQFNQKYPRPGK